MKIKQIDAQIAKLREQKKQMVEKYLKRISIKIAKSIVDRKLFDLDEKDLMDKINKTLDEMCPHE